MAVESEGPNESAPGGVSPDLIPPEQAPRGRRRLVVVALLGAVALVLLALSPSFGRADPTGNYRPALSSDALVDGCWPLPGGVLLDFGYQVRTDDLVDTATGERRRIVLHYDEISGADAVAAVRADFAAAGLADDVEASAHDFTETDPDARVRGEMTLDLPASEPDGRPECQDPFSTKRFTPDMEDRS